jgi:2-haloacid dehalogenase
MFDTFGTVVDWRPGVARDVAAFAQRHRLADLHAWAFNHAWRAKCDPSMDSIRNGTRGFVPLDQLQRASLIPTLTEFGLHPAD